MRYSLSFALSFILVFDNFFECSVLMATYGEDFGVLYSHCTGVGEGDEDLLTLYSTLSPTTFTDMASFNKSIMSCYNNFVAGSNVHHQYIAFTHVTLKRFDEIDALWERRTSLPKMVVLYDGTEEVLIVKLMLSPLHNSAVVQFHDLFHGKFVELGVHKKIYVVGSGRFGEANARCKEADNAYRPVERHRDDFPSLVVEGGISESLQMLKSDARYWLTKTGGQTQIVIILHIDQSTKKILLQRWECVDNVRRATVQYPPLCQMIQSLELEAGEEDLGDVLEIPAIKVFDTVVHIYSPGVTRFLGISLGSILSELSSFLLYLLLCLIMLHCVCSMSFISIVQWNFMDLFVVWVVVFEGHKRQVILFCLFLCNLDHQNCDNQLLKTQKNRMSIDLQTNGFQSCREFVSFRDESSKVFIAINAPHAYLQHET